MADCPHCLHLHCETSSSTHPSVVSRECRGYRVAKGEALQNALITDRVSQHTCCYGANDMWPQLFGSLEQMGTDPSDAHANRNAA